MISIIIPALNEADGIGSTIDALRQVLDEADEPEAEIVVVDDGSSDDTGRIAAEAGAKVVRHPHNVGYGQSLKTGIVAASHDTIVIIDADRTYPAEAIPRLLAHFRDGFDMVVGARTGHHYEGGAFKGPLRQILKFVVEFSAGRAIPDANSGLRIFSRETIQPYLPHLCNTFSFTTSLTLAYMMTGRFVDYLPIDYHERVGRTKVRLFMDSLRTLQYIVQAIIYYSPLKLFLLLTLLTILLAIGGFLTAAITGLNAPYFLGVGGLLVSILVFSLGLLADLLRQILVRAGVQRAP
jgi:glycosyltransferase involved in cell wall biosynthesis